MSARIDQSQKQPQDYSSEVAASGAAAPSPQAIAATLPGTVDARGVDDVAKSTRSISTHKGAPVLPKSQAKAPDYTTISTGITNTIQAVMTSIEDVALIFAQIYNRMQESETREKTKTIEDIAEKMKTEATQMRESAAMTLAAGVVTGSMQIASAGVTAAQLKGGIGGGSSVTEEEPLSPSPEGPMGESEEGVLGGPEETEESPSQLEEEEGAFSGAGSSEGGLGESEGPGMTGRSGRPSAGAPGEDSISEANQSESEQAARTRGGDEEVTRQEETRSRAARTEQQKESQRKGIKAGQGKKKKMMEGEMFLLGQKEARITMKAQAMSQALSGAGGIASAGLKMGADEKGAEEKETEARIESVRSYKSSLDDFVQDARDSMQKMLKMASDLQQAYNDTLQKIAER